MSSTPDSTSKKLWKTKKFWFIFLFIAYSTFGWLGIPYIVKQQAISALKDIARWDTQIESVVFNPYALSLAIHNFEAKDEFQQDAVNFERLYVNVNALGSITGQLAFDEISLTKPVVNAQIDKNGLSNFQRDFVKEEATPDKEETTNSDPIALFFSLISISHGRINFSDNRTDETFKLKLDPLNLALHDFSTDQNDGGDYSLKLSLGQGQELNWKGQIGIAPFSSKGSFELKNLRSSSFWHYAKPFSPYTLQNSLISLAADYDTRFSDSDARLIIDDGAIAIETIKLAETPESEAFLELDSINLKPIEFNLENRQAQLGMLAINAPKLKAVKNEASQINLLTPLQATTSEQESSTTEQTINPDSTEKTPKSNTPFTWSIAGIKLNEGSINWQDLSLEDDADLSVEHINLALGKITHELDKSFSYQLNFNTDETQQNIKGELTAAPFRVNGDLNLNSLPLTWAQPYIGEQLNVELAQGQLSLASEYTLQLADQGLTGKITANTAIDQLSLKDSVIDQDLAGFQTFSVSGVDLTLDGKGQAPSVTVNEIKLSQPFAKALISESGTMNLSQLSKSTSKLETNETTEAASIDTETENEANPTTNIAIDKVLIEGGRFDYVDASLKPVFNTYIDQFSGSIENISSDLEAHSKVALSGNLDSYGKIAIDGTTNPLSTKPNTALNIQVNNIDLTTASPYSAKFAGYLIDKGKLDLDLAYDIKGTQLNAENKVFIDQFNFGDSVDSPDATSLPLPLAIGIMKNLDGEIDIDLPISGDLNDPSFSFGGVLITAFTNLITKIVTSPFSILGSLVEGADDISSVSFLASSQVLSQVEADKLNKLATALKKRPKLSLEVRGVSDRSIDLDQNKQPLSEDKLAILAKNRALFITKILVEQGGIPEKRVFTLEPKVVTGEPANTQQINHDALSVSSTFTIKID